MIKLFDVRTTSLGGTKRMSLTCDLNIFIFLFFSIDGYNVSGAHFKEFEGLRASAYFGNYDLIFKNWFQIKAFYESHDGGKPGSHLRRILNLFSNGKILT